MSNTSTSNKPAWIFVILGLIEIILGIIALGLPGLTGITFMWLVGGALLVAMVLSIYQIFTVPNYRLWNLLTAVLYGLAGSIFIWHPLSTLASLTILLGWLFVIGGGVRLFMSYKTKSGWLMFNGLITLLLGIFIISRWPEDTTVVIGTFIAIDLIISGWTMSIVGAFLKRKG